MGWTTIPAQCIASLTDLSVELGCNRADLLQGIEFPAATIDARVDAAHFTRLANRAIALTGDCALGLKFGQRLNISVLSNLGLAMLNSSNLNEAITLLDKYVDLICLLICHPLKRDERRCSLYLGSEPGIRDPHFVFDTWCATLAKALAYLLGVKQIPLRVEFPYPRPKHVAELESLFGRDLHFDRIIGRISFDLALESIPLRNSNPVLCQFYVDECEKLLSEMFQLSEAQQVLCILRASEGNYPTSAQLASRMQISYRTLNRHLATEGTSYQQLLDRVRAEHAAYRLSSSQMTVEEIATVLGFSDPSHFRRSFVKLTDIPVQDIRDSSHSTRP